MSSLRRFSIAMEQRLFERLERMVRKAGYANRSEFIRDLLRDRLVDEQWTDGDEVIGTITIVYKHDTRMLSERLTRVQHLRHDLVLATTHIHLDEAMCAEMIMARGNAKEIRKLVDLLRQQKGVLHATLCVGSTGKSLV